MRRVDSGWRDTLLAVRHAEWGFAAPAPGMSLPFVEYDHGVPLAVVSYISRAAQLPRGEDVTRAYHAMGMLHRQTGEKLPYLTAVYDPRNWAFRVFGHNDAAHEFLDTRDWIEMTEQQLVNNLYRLRGRYVPDLSSFGVEFSRDGWIATEPSADWPREVWPGALMSARRRNYEPVRQVRASWRNPCVDIDFAVIDREDRVALVVDYKAAGARIGLDSTNIKALSDLYTTYGGTRAKVPAMVVRYEPNSAGWKFWVHCANGAARRHLAYVLTPQDDVETAAKAIAGIEWVDLTEAQWKTVLNAAREL